MGFFIQNRKRPFVRHKRRDDGVGAGVKVVSGAEGHLDCRKKLHLPERVCKEGGIEDGKLPHPPSRHWQVGERTRRA